MLMRWKRGTMGPLCALIFGALALHATCAAQTSSQARTLAQARKAIRHVVVLYQENVSFDHYFGTYPHALNPKGEPAFTPLPGTPKVAGYTAALLKRNPNFLNPK